MSYKMIMIN